MILYCRISCLNSRLEFEGGLMEGAVQEDGTDTYVSFPDGIPYHYVGLYSCISRVNRTLHYIVNCKT